MLCELWQPNVATLMAQIILQLELNWLRPLHDIRTVELIDTGSSIGSKARTCGDAWYIIDVAPVAGSMLTSWPVHSCRCEETPFTAGGGADVDELACSQLQV